MLSRRSRYDDSRRNCHHNNRISNSVWKKKNSNLQHQSQNYPRSPHSAPSSENKDENPSINPFIVMNHTQSSPTHASIVTPNPFSRPSYSTKEIHKSDPSSPSESPKKLYSIKPFKICKQIPSHSENTVLRSGMVLLRSFLTPMDQIFIVKNCDELGSCPSGFHQPGYKSGAKLRLQMMCLGKYWDTETGKYFERRPSDDSKPPDILPEFTQMVRRSVDKSRALILNDEDVEESDIDKILPQISPDICIVNFYTTTGRLGLHRDKDESRESLHDGIPVVSFSIGNSAEFLYGDERDAEKASSVVLKSGDCLIFGGKSRHVFHGVASIIPRSSPQFLSEVLGFRASRLNLTFRQY